MTSSISATHFIFFFLFIAYAQQDESFFIKKSMDRKLLGLETEQLSHLRLYWHDVLSGDNPTSMEIIPPISNKFHSGFGYIRMIDNALTEEQDRSSKLLGRAQGFYASASQDKVALLMAMNFVFTSGKYNGSSISLFGRNPWMENLRELSVIGGSGLFRFARGYAQLHTVELDIAKGNAVVEYNIYLFHYADSISSF
ncbi:dirigent protein 20-like [Benincasa hispida]|uniref:dirigent protein 20-like n=1 Tax=Benincasa hispida TaxID=102211 RepID=UPI001901DE14|nr:dirigent protein 20-like [Benincasa hispida]